MISINHTANNLKVLLSKFKGHLTDKVILNRYSDSELGIKYNYTCVIITLRGSVL
jgi:hypothetical protein